MARMTFTDLPIRFQSFSIENEKHSKATWSFNKVYWTEDESIVSVAQRLFEQYKVSQSGKIRTTKLEEDYLNTIIVIICNVAAIYHSGRDGIAVKLGSNEFTCNLRKYKPIKITRTVFKNLIKWLSASDYIHLYVAPRGNKSESCSVIEILPRITELLDLNCFARNVIEVHPEFSFVQKTVQKELVDFIDNEEMQHRNNILKAYNDLLTERNITIHGKPIIKPVCLTTTFINSECEHGRIYGGAWINCKSDSRESIKIDECQTIELDIRNSTLRLAAHLSGFDSQLADDLYAIEGYDRELVKLISTSMQNVNGKSTLDGLKRTTNAVHKSLRKDAAKRGAWRLVADGEEPKDSEKRLLKLLNKNMSNTDFLRRYGIHYNLQELRLVVNAVYEKLTSYAEAWLLRGRGLELMYYESKVTFKVIEEFLRLNEVVLTIHDSYIVKTSNKQLLEDVIQRSYKDLTGFLPKLKCK